MATYSRMFSSSTDQSFSIPLGYASIPASFCRCQTEHLLAFSLLLEEAAEIALKASCYDTRRALAMTPDLWDRARIAEASNYPCSAGELCNRTGLPWEKTQQLGFIPPRIRMQMMQPGVPPISAEEHWRADCPFTKRRRKASRKPMAGDGA
jgi:hypothetical protein